MSAGAIYDSIGRGYARQRRPDPRIAARLHEALGGARSVLNVGAGAGSYEPPDRRVVAVEPSEVMLAQRPPNAAPAVRARRVRAGGAAARRAPDVGPGGGRLLALAGIPASFR